MGLLDYLLPWLLLLSLFAISNSWTVVCFLLDCVCCELMAFVVVGLFCCGGGINSNGYDGGFGDI